MRKKYETDITDKQWKVIAPLFVNMRKRKWEKRQLVNAVLYLVKTGCQWRNLPHDFPPVFTLHSFYRLPKRENDYGRLLPTTLGVFYLSQFTKRICTILAIGQQDQQFLPIRRCRRYAGMGAIAAPLCEAYKYFGFKVEVSKKLKPHGWQVLPKRWRGERTFAWLNHSRRLSKDYELTVTSAETMIKISHIHTLPKRL